MWITTKSVTVLKSSWFYDSSLSFIAFLLSVRFLHTFIGARLIAYSDTSLRDLQSETKLGEIYYLVTNPDLSGPIPTRPPPRKGSFESTTPQALTKRSFSLQSTPKRIDMDDELDDDEDDDELPQKSKRALNDISNFVLDLPPFATGNFSQSVMTKVRRFYFESITS